jgi:5'-3' exonuclease
MKKNKCTLIIDGNWLLLSRFSVIGRGFEQDMPEQAKEHAKTELHELMAKSISIVLNRFSIIDNVVLVTDGGSWRKQLPIPKAIENVTYKGNRTTAKELDWKYIYGALTDLTERCKELGVTVANHSSIEGDDWVWYWSRRLNAEGTSCIIWSSDNDLKQLVQNDSSTMAFTAWYNDKNGIWLESSMNDEIVDELEFFMSPIKVKSPILENLVQLSKSTSYINPDDIVMEKIICGDAGDNIKSIAKVVSGNKTYKVSVKMWNEIKQGLNINSLSDFFNYKNRIISAITGLKKFVNCDTADISEMFDYNIKLVWLNETISHETIIMYMNQLEYNITDISYIRSNFRTMCRKDNSIEAIFESI